MSDPETIRLSRILTEYEPGDGGTWLQEFAWIAMHRADRLQDLARSIEASGIRQPILLGDDGRVWDGHHRILIATHLDMETVPATHAQKERTMTETPNRHEEPEVHVVECHGGCARVFDKPHPDPLFVCRQCRLRMGQDF